MAGRRKKETQIFANKQKPRHSWIDFLRLDESYTSLLLGIIVVIIGSILLVSFVKNRNTSNVHQETSSASIAPTQLYNIPLTISPTPSPEVSGTVTPTQEPTATLTPLPTTHQITKPTPMHIATPTLSPLKTQPRIPGTSYTVKTGDELWHIAEQKYGSGYNWVDIAKANNLDNPGLLYVGMKLILPQVEPKLSTTTNTVQNIQPQNKIVGSTYTVQKGDSLWSIAERAYNDGYQWTKIAETNHLAKPSVIYSGNVLQIPRG